MTWLRYVLYFISIALVTLALTQMEIASPGSLKLHVVVAESDIYGTSEFSPVEIIQAIILGICGLIMLWVARYCPSQRPIAFGFGGLALVFLIRESDYFLDRFIADNLWQVLVAIVGSLLIAYTYRHRKRLTIALARIWPSPGVTLLFAGAVILFAFVPLVGHEPLWQSILGNAYQRVIKLAIEEVIELMGYYLWMIGTIEYAFEARAIAYREPQPAARRKRDKRRRKSKGTF
jgi:multisubunit Na+/H+ antiporter MnhB subunit